MELADDPPNHVLMELLPGDIQFINNYHVLHGRTAYEDDRAAGRVRHLKRLWLETSVLATGRRTSPTTAPTGTTRTASRLEVR